MSANRSEPRGRHRGLDELGLAAVALGRHDQLAGQLAGDLGSVVLADDVQAQVDARRTAGRRQDVALVDVEHAGVDRHIRILAGQFVALRPVGGRPATVEQARLGQDERAGAQRDDPASTGMGPSQGFDHLRRHLVEVLGGRDHQVSARRILSSP